MIDRAALRALVRQLEVDGPEGVPAALARLKAMGAVLGIHEGKAPESFTAQETTEWFAGQVVDLLERRAYSLVHVQTLFNVLDKFVPPLDVT